MFFICIHIKFIFIKKYIKINKIKTIKIIEIVRFKIKLKEYKINLNIKLRMKYYVNLDLCTIGFDHKTLELLAV